MKHGRDDYNKSTQNKAEIIIKKTKTNLVSVYEDQSSTVSDKTATVSYYFSHPFLFLPPSLSPCPASLPQLVKSQHVTLLDCNSQDLTYATCGCALKPVNYIKPIKKISYHRPVMDWNNYGGSHFDCKAHARQRGRKEE